jgi:anti-anti-sigma factor
MSCPDTHTLSVEVTGEIDLHTSGYLQRAALTELDPVPDLVVLDMRQVTFLGVSAITALITIRDAIEGRGGRMCIYPSPAVQRVLQPACVEDRFDVRTASPATGGRP